MDGDVPTFKLVLVGDVGVVKPLYIKNHFTGEFERRIVSKYGIEVFPLEFNTTTGMIKFNVWDATGKANFRSLRDEYFSECQCAIIKFGVTPRVTHRYVPGNWQQNLSLACGKIPIFFCGERADVNDKKVHSKSITFHRKTLPYHDMSADSSYSPEKPFLWLARKLLNNEDLQLVEMPAPAFPEPQTQPYTTQDQEQDQAQEQEYEFKFGDKNVVTSFDEFYFW